MTAVAVFPASTPAQVVQARELFEEYAASLGFSLCFQNFSQELESLPGKYAPPPGCLLLAAVDGELAGCVALHAISAEICEMKRLYVRPSFRGCGVGRALVLEVIAAARHRGYQRMRLDTVAGMMDRALALYRKLGFIEIPSYTENPVAGALCMELNIAP